MEEETLLTDLLPTPKSPGEPYEAPLAQLCWVADMHNLLVHVFQFDPLGPKETLRVRIALVGYAEVYMAMRAGAGTSERSFEFRQDGGVSLNSSIFMHFIGSRYEPIPFLSRIMSAINSVWGKCVLVHH